MDDTGKAYIDKGVQSLKTHSSKNKLIDAIYDICEFLEERLRFEMAIGYYNALMEFESDKAKVHDSLSYCYFCLGDMEQVFESQRKALELCDTKPRFYCNMGWFKLIQGDLTAAKAIFDIIWEAYYSGYFFYDDIDELRDNFKTIMHKVILKTGDIDEEIFGSVLINS